MHKKIWKSRKSRKLCIQPAATEKGKVPFRNAYAITDDDSNDSDYYFGTC